MTGARAWIAATQEYIAAATRGPWVVVDNGEGVEAAPDGGPDDWLGTEDEPHGPNVATAWDAGPFANDSAFMAGARTDLPKALAALSAVLDKCDAMEAEAQVGGFIAREVRGVIERALTEE